MMAGKIGFTKLRSHLIGTGVALVGSVAFTYLPNTVGIKYAKQYIQASLPYCKSISAEPETVALLNEVVHDINKRQEKPVKEDGIEFLQTNNLDPMPFHKGNSSTGSMIGLPIGLRCNAEDVFHYHCPDHVSLEMANFCLLNKEAKKFLLAREIYYVQDSYIMFRCLLGLALVATGSALHYVWNTLMNNLKQMKLQMKVIEANGKINSKTVQEFYARLQLKAWRQRSYTFVIIFLGLTQVYRVINNFYNYELERSADEQVASLGPEYRKGGLEYYQKLVMAGKYNNMQNAEMSPWDKSGNQIQGKYPLIFKHVPSTLRERYFSMKAPQEQVANTKS